MAYKGTVVELGQRTGPCLGVDGKPQRIEPLDERQDARVVQGPRRQKRRIRAAERRPRQAPRVEGARRVSCARAHTHRRSGLAWEGWPRGHPPTILQVGPVTRDGGVVVTMRTCDGEAAWRLRRV